MHRRIVVALLVPSLVPLLLLVLVSPRAQASQPTAAPSPIGTADILCRECREYPLSPTATVTVAHSDITSPPAPETRVPFETPVVSAQVTALPTPVISPTWSPTPPAAPTPLSVAGVVGGIIPFVQTNPLLSAVLAGVFLLAIAILLVTARKRRQPQFSTLTTRPLDASVAVLQGVTVPELKFHLDREQFTVGRASDCSFRIPDNVRGTDTISRQHARLEKRGERWAVIDGVRDGELSANGIFVNGKRTLENYLTDDDEVSFGNLAFRFHTRSANSGPQEEPR